MAVGSLCMSPTIVVCADSDPFEEKGREDWEKGLADPDGWDCKGCTTDKHITSSTSTITAGNGTITVTVNPVYSENNKRKECVIGIINEQQKAVEGKGNYYYSPDLMSGNDDTPDKESQFFEGDPVTFNGLPNGTTYYVYAIIMDTHGGEYDAHSVHYAKYLGSATPTASSGSSSSSSSSSASSGSNTSGSSNSKSAWASYEEKVSNQIEAAPSGSTIVMEKGVSTLSNSMMKELLEKGDVSLKLEFTYNDVEYVIIIPAGAALDSDIPWYGPLYLAQQFGNSAGGAAPAAVKAGGAYEVKSGDSMNKIATANNMTLTQLLTKNPQIKDPNKIVVGQKINL